MTHFSLVFNLAFFFIGSASLGGESGTPTSSSWSGIIINSGCTADEAFAEAAKCTEKIPGTKLVLYDDTTRQMFDLDPQDQAVGHLGDSVTVHGSLEGNSIRVSSLELLTSIGLPVGQEAPPFSLRDQFGYDQTLESLKGSRGTVLLFFRSADWCPYCKGQLVELQGAKAKFEKQGLTLAGVGYDSEAILKYFADRRKIDFPLLADPDSKIIHAYEVFNTEAAGKFKGMARPGYFFIDPGGVIREKFFEARYRERLPGNNVIAKLFPELGQEVVNVVEEPHIQLAVEQSDRTAFPGGRITLTADVKLPPDTHVYAPGAKDYKPINLVIDPMPGMRVKPAVYPQSRILFLPALKERVPVLEGTFRISQDLQVATAADFSNSLGTDGKTFTVTGKLEYQACDSKICFLPNSAPLQWHLHVLPLDRQRAPEDVRLAPHNLSAHYL